MKSAAVAKVDIDDRSDADLSSTQSGLAVLRPELKINEALRTSSSAAQGRKAHVQQGALLALFLVAIGMASLGIWVGRDLPSLNHIPYLRYEAQGARPHGSTRVSRPGPKLRFVHLNEISRYVPQALIAAEDRDFYSHFGVNPKAILRAAYTDVRAWAPVEGGSTLTEQLAKNLLPDRGSPIHQKLQEMVLALELEHRFTKNQILELYLNKVYFGSGAYGIYAASQRYFAKPPKKLDLYEAALLIGLLPAPSVFNPRHDPKLAAKRTQVVLHDMVENGSLTTLQADEAIAGNTKAQ